MTDQLWAPWRLEYVGSAEEARGCIFCAALEQPGEARSSCTVESTRSRSSTAFRTPRATSWSRRSDTPATSATCRRPRRSRSTGSRPRASPCWRLYAPQGYNLGWNLGRVAGAGIVDHVHLHVVPRWGGDTNFMPVLADVRVIPEHLAETHRRLVDAWPGDGQRGTA